MTFRVTDLMVNVLPEDPGRQGPVEPDCRNDTRGEGCPLDTRQDCPFDTTRDKRDDIQCPTQTFIPPPTSDCTPPSQAQAATGLGLLQQQLDRTLSQLR